MAANRQNNCQKSIEADHFVVATGVGPGYIRLNSMIASGHFVRPACQKVEPRPDSTDSTDRIVRPKSSLAGSSCPSLEERKWAKAVDAVIRV